MCSVEILNQYFYEEPNFEIEYNSNILLCYNCNSSSLVNDNNHIICRDCAVIQPTLIFESWKFQIGQNFTPMYSRGGHWKKILRSVQGEMVACVKPEIIDILKKEKFNSVQDLKKIMIKHKMKKYYLSIYWIYRQLTGINLIHFEKRTYIKLIYMFQDISRTFNDLELKGRVNFLQYHYVLIKCLRLIGKTKPIKHLFSMKDKTKIKYSESVFKQICDKLNWNFIAEVPKKKYKLVSI